MNAPLFFDKHAVAPMAHALRLDANETTILARSLEAHAIAAVEHVYPGLRARQLFPLNTRIGVGHDTYTWHEIQKEGSAEIIANYADDLPSVGQFISENTGKIRTIGNSYEYSVQDLERAAAARGSALHEVLDPMMPQVAREFIERKIDEIAAIGDTNHALPGALKNANVAVTNAAAPWLTGATPATVHDEILKALSDIRENSEGAYAATTCVLPIGQLMYISRTPLLASGDNRITIRQAVEAMGSQLGSPVRFVDWTQCNGAGAGATDRAMFYQQTADVLEMINPLPFEARPPQASGLHWSVPCRARVGGVLIKKPLACKYVDQI